MLHTRLWMGAILIGLAVGMLWLDASLAPVYPFLLVFQIGLALAGGVEMILLLGPHRRPLRTLTIFGLFALNLANWIAHWAGVSPSGLFLGLLTALVPIGFLWEMARFAAPQQITERLARTVFLYAYLGLLPFYFAQLRWLPRGADLALALAIFVPKCCDVGAYTFGRLFGRHPMTPFLSPKKTWEGAVGGLAFACLVTVLLDRNAATPLLHGNLNLEILFGVTVGIAGMLGDLAESLLKRDCQSKDASQIVPGFGGVLDVVDAVLFAAPVVYLWMLIVRPLAA